MAVETQHQDYLGGGDMYNDQGTFHSLKEGNVPHNTAHVKISKIKRGDQDFMLLKTNDKYKKTLTMCLHHVFFSNFSEHNGTTCYNFQKLHS